MYSLQHIPFLRILAAYIAGILINRPEHIPMWMGLLIGSISIILLITYAAIPKHLRYQSIIVTTAAYTFFFTVGLLNPGYQFAPGPNPKHFNQTVIYRGTLLSFPTEKANSWQLLLKPEASSGIPFHKQENILINLSKPLTENLPEPGDGIIVKGKLYAAADPPAPGGFDYAGYLMRRGIRYRLFVTEGNLIPNPLNKKKPYILVLRIRNHLYKQLQKYLTHSENQALAAAILLGQRQLLEQETRDAFAGSGIVHLLAVSGLHVGIIYLFFSRIFLFVKRRRYGNLLHAAGCLSVVWLYALITGGSPSVLRASVMFSFLIGAQLIRRDNISLNAVLASAFLLLLFNPSLLMEAGFQLSYLAVISILLFYPLLENLLRPRTIAGKYIWQLTCLSLTAQAGTLPLSLYYFNSLPVWFLPVNLLAVPLTGIILYTGMSLFLLSWLPPLASLLSTFLEQGLSLLNTISHTANQLPLSHLEPVCIHLSTVCFLYLSALILYHTITRKRVSSLIVLLLVLLLSQCILLFHNYKLRQKVLLTFYNGYTAFDYSILKEGQFYYGNAEPSPEVLQHQLNMRLTKGHPLITETDSIYNGNKPYPQLLNLEGKKILILNGEDKPPSGKADYETDLLVLGPYIPASWHKWLLFSSPKEVIHIGNHYRWQHIHQWQEQEADKNKIYTSYEKGYILTLSELSSKPKK